MPVGRQPWRRKEIVPADEQAPGLPARMRQIHGNDRVDRLAVDGVVLAHADPQVAASIDDTVGKPPVARPRWRNSQRLRLSRGVSLPVEPAIRKIGEVENSLCHGPSTTAIFVYPRAHIVRRGVDISIFSTCHTRLRDDQATLLLWPSFQPIDNPAIETNFR